MSSFPYASKPRQDWREWDGGFGTTPSSQKLDLEPAVVYANKPAISDSFHPKCVRADFPFKIMEDETASRYVSGLIKKTLQSTTLAFAMRQ